MIRIDSKNMNFNGSSIVDGSTIASLNATVNEPDSNAYININLPNLVQIRSNLAAVKSDISAFLEEILRQPVEYDD